MNSTVQTSLPRPVAGASTRTSKSDDAGGENFASSLDEPINGKTGSSGKAFGGPENSSTASSPHETADTPAAKDRGKAQTPAELLAKLFGMPDAQGGEAVAAPELTEEVPQAATEQDEPTDSDARQGDNGEDAKDGATAGAAAVASPAMILIAPRDGAKNPAKVAADDGRGKNGEVAAVKANAGTGATGQAPATGARQAAAASAAAGTPATPTTSLTGGKSSTAIGAGNLGGASGSDDGAGKPAVTPQGEQNGDGSSNDGGAKGEGSDTGSPLSRIKVVSSQTSSIPAPAFAHPAASPTASSLANAIHADLSAAPSATVAVPDQPSAPAAVHTLKIQLQPEALGMVTAQLHLAGDTLRVDIKVENADAHHRLNSDSDAIVKSLRALGYDVDHVTIQTASAPAPSPNAHNATAGGRDQSFQQQAGNNASGQGSNHAGNGRGQGEQSRQHIMERPESAASSGGGLFI